MKLTLKKLIWATLVSMVFSLIKLMNEDPWISPSDIRFWANDIAIVIGWVLYFMERKKK